MFEVFFLSIIQGITEFLPVSSSAHLILLAQYLNFNNENLTLDISLHFGSLCAVMVYFRKDLLEFVDKKFLFFKIVLSSIPVMIFGFFLIKFDLLDSLRNLKLIGWTTIIFGILLYFSDLSKVKKTINKDFKLSTAIFIGLFQIISLIPGVSRSGIVITGGRFFNFSRTDSTKISFLMSIPTLSIISLYNLKNLSLEKNLAVSQLNFFGILFSFLFSYFTIKYFLKYIKKFNLTIFVLYRIFLGILILFFSY